MAEGAHFDHQPHADHGRIDDIEVLRAIAVGMVLVEHVRINLITWVWGVHEPLYRVFGFWSGVDLFFAISGFVIARSLLPMLQDVCEPAEFLNVSLAFWVRRAWRLLPSAWLWLAVILVCAAAFNRSGAFEPLRSNIESVVAAVLNIANFRTVYILRKYPTGAAFPYWSLSLEEQFYLILPFLIFFTRRRLPWALLAIVAAQLFVKRSGPHSVVVLNMVRSDALCLGVLLAIWRSRPSYWRFEPRALRQDLIRILLPPTLIAVFALLSGNPYDPPRFQIGGVALAAAAIVWLASYDGDYFFPPGRLKQAFCWLGARSYAVYLIHIPAFFATREIFFRLRPNVLTPSWAHLVLLLTTGLLVVLVLAELNYRFVERPLRAYGAGVAQRIRQRDLASLTATPEPVHV